MVKVESGGIQNTSANVVRNAFMETREKDDAAKIKQKDLKLLRNDSNKKWLLFVSELLTLKSKSSKQMFAYNSSSRTLVQCSFLC